MKILMLCILLVSVNAQTSWSGFRGDGNSHSVAKNLPISWSDTKGVAWKFSISDYGQSSPVIWEDKVFVTSNEGNMKETLCIYCIDLKKGSLLWKKTFPSSVKSKRNKMVAQAASTPVVDGKGLYAFFESGDLIAVDFEGNILWQRILTKEYGSFKGNHGIGSSLAQTTNSVIVFVEHEGPSYLMSIDKKTGKNIWKNNHSARVSWTSPLVSQNEIIISSNGSVEVYSTSDGKLLWFINGIKKNTVPSPSCNKDIIVIGSSAKNWCMAIRRTGKAKVMWNANVASSFASPLITTDNVYFVNRAGIVFCLNLLTGKKRWSSRLPSSVWASPINVGDYVYFFCKDGTTIIAKENSEKLQQISLNKLSVGKTLVYGVAVTDNYFVFRTGKEIIAVSTVEFKNN
ncbi:PQQ-binding-like beta-propeller repeat protein [Candidatus Uabimicrobium sp. HlEnr_7]|uniref:outer membrane protein assembly factor BamB family protein n=1 Tax=Candidatus Uabimicrobium helgolandensis TaxID=3095367 RepID=UPI0035591150